MNSGRKGTFTHTHYRQAVTIAALPNWPLLLQCPYISSGGHPIAR